MNKFRIYVLLVVFTISFIGLLVRLFYWQIVKGAELSQAAAGQHKNNLILEAPRGEIFATDGSWLASRGERWTLTANPKEVSENPRELAEEIVDILSKDNDELSDKKSVFEKTDKIASLLDKKNLYWIALENRLDGQKKEELEKLSIKGLGFEKEESRYYPEASESAHLLGFLGKNENGESVGYFGLEGYYDEMLSGKKGYVSRDSDAGGIPILFGNFRETKSINGIDLVTSIDKYIQFTIENKLHDGMIKYGAKAATAIVADPITGEILAMAAYPTFDQSKYYQFDNSLFINPTISQSFEPGSIFKVIVMASGIDGGVVEPDTKCDICSGPLKIDKYYIKTWNNKYTADSTMTDVIVHSDNVGMSFVGRKLGADKFYDYLSSFGFGKLTGIDLQGESSPALRKKGTWREIDIATTSFGQGVAVTPIQMIKAVSVIANHGLLTNPRVVKKFKNESWEYEADKGEVKRVISDKTAKKVTQMMVEAVKNGESKWTNLRGFSVAGKTGTAQIPIEGHYDAEKTIASFVGFAPANDPKFIMLITLREPESSQWASETAAPLWFSIAKDLFLYYGIQPEN